MARQQAAQPPAPAAVPDVLTAALARAVCVLAVRLPGAPASLRQILTGQLGLPGEHADAIIAAAESKPGS